MTDKLIHSHEGNFTHGRTAKIIRGYFHRTAVKGDTAEGEGNYFANNCVKASFYKVIDLDGNVIESLPPTDTEWATDNWNENLDSLSYEFTGLNGTPLTHAQIQAAIADIKADPATKTIATHRLSITEIRGGHGSGWANHKDVTTAYATPGGHVDGISESEIALILAELS